MPIKLKKSFSTRNNRPIYYLEGDTYPIRSKLGRQGLGFSWYGARKMWWIYADKLNLAKKQTLTNMGVDMSDLGEAPAQPQSPAEYAPAEPEVPELTNKVDTDSGKYMKDVKDSLGAGYDTVPGRYGFPIKTNIYSIEVTLNVDGQEVPVIATLDRWYKKARRKIPRYVYNISYKDKQIWNGARDAEGEWGTYNEDQIAVEIPQEMQKVIEQKKRLYKRVLEQLELDQRDPDLVKFLKEWDEFPGYDLKSEQSFVSPYLSPKTIQINETGYEEAYPIALHKVGKGIYFKTLIDHPLAPGTDILTTINIPADIRNIAHLDKYIDTQILAHSDEISARYLKYLKSFPFRKEEEEASRAEMKEVADMIGTNYNVTFFRDKLEELGYIRPSKRGRKTPGFMPRESIKWVIESKKIVNDAYSYGQDPNAFYSMIAYWLHRKIRNISSFTEMNLSWGINHWYRLAKQYGHEVSQDDVWNYFDKVSSDLYRALFDREPPKSMGDKYQDFYSGGQGQQQVAPGASSGDAMGQWVAFAASLGINAELAQTDPKGVYRQLAKQYHPDINPEGADIFKQLAETFNRLPLEVTRAFNWYWREKYS